MLRRTRDEYEPPAPRYEEDDEPYRRPRIGGRRTTAVLLLLALAFLAIGVLRVAGVDGSRITVAALALTPYVAPGGLLLALIAFGLRRRILATCVLLIALSMVVLLLPRLLPDGQPGAAGMRVRIMSANLHDGRADPAAIMRAVRDNRVDVLNLPELQPGELAALDAAGMPDELPYRVVDPGVGGGGSGIASRYPLRQIVLVESIELSQPSAVVDLPGRADLEILAVHVQSATHDATVWRRDLDRLPPATPDRVRVLAGDFNATLDHAAFRAVLDLGYVDAAEQTGKGLIPTWSSWRLGPPITIDHILADHRCAIQRFAVLNLPGSDHDAVFADVQLP
ncbi:MAG TPA: endonuclease/exonuclease/phosphatase family protein [Actinophytocola sp.]|uniref:endonuclease/exonuclease/phosphatase family protein n=1 Tax=Actinophytocola sp. TaxID=1872138 RepID=UPI002DDCD76C|nr:endonuclease/exonuclease/phosphatase family protein [Actinophytocola sp.]HEV2783271.1 endonuclease/exonuclease/phosphatase family protein [Actinophytocola sp.]